MILRLDSSNIDSSVNNLKKCLIHVARALVGTRALRQNFFSWRNMTDRSWKHDWARKVFESTTTTQSWRSGSIKEWNRIDRHLLATSFRWAWQGETLLKISTALRSSCFRCCQKNVIRGKKMNDNQAQTMKKFEPKMQKTKNLSHFSSEPTVTFTSLHLSLLLGALECTRLRASLSRHFVTSDKSRFS
jgi:hypothetical protein